MIVIEAFSKVIPTGESWLKLSLKRKHCPKSVSNPDVLYGLNNTGAQKMRPKEVFLTFFPCIFYVKTKWNSLQILWNKNLLKQRKCASPLSFKYFQSLSFHWGVASEHLYTNFQKTVCPKKRLNPALILPWYWNISIKGTQIWTHRMAFFTINIWLENSNGSFDVSFKSNEANDILITIY